MICPLAKELSALGTGVLSTLSNNTKETVFHTATHKISNGVLCCLLSLPATMQKKALQKIQNTFDKEATLIFMCKFCKSSV
jgi:hypothetical protein